MESLFEEQVREEFFMVLEKDFKTGSMNTIKMNEAEYGFITKIKNDEKTSTIRDKAFNYGVYSVLDENGVDSSVKIEIIMVEKIEITYIKPYYFVYCDTTLKRFLNSFTYSEGFGGYENESILFNSLNRFYGLSEENPFNGYIHFFKHVEG